MIGKNLLTVLIFVVVLAVGFFGYQHFKTNKELDAHHKNTYLGLTAAAKVNPRAGMPQMGMAINKYYAENKSYPPNLDALYPKYINDKSFISDVNWNYQPTDDNFQLSNSVVSGGRTLVASTDKGLSVRAGTTTTVAMVDANSTPVSTAVKPGQRSSGKADTALAELVKDASSDLSPLAEVSVGQIEKAKERKNIALSETETRAVVIDETETPSGLVSELSNAYLVWKDEQGRLGFGNVQYPQTDMLSIATPYNWFNVKRSEDDMSSVQENTTSAGAIDMEAVASKYSDLYLVWKDKNGNIGFSDTEYPDQEEIKYVNIDGTWHKFAR